MASEIETKDFNFEVCPYCSTKYSDRQIIRVQSDDAGPCRLFL